MVSVREQLEWFLSLNRNEQWMPPHIALQQLEHWGDDLIPGLVECLGDGDSEIRQLAVQLLGEAHPLSSSAVPDLIARLDDENRLVRAAAAVHISDFGAIAVQAIPHLENWLSDEDDYLRTIAMTRILYLDPTRTEFIPDIRHALASENLMVRCLAREYFAKTQLPLPFDEAAFQETTRLHWTFRSLSQQVWWRSEVDENGTWNTEIAPVYQEVFGGADDGIKVWPGYEFDVDGFMHEHGIKAKSISVKSRCAERTPIPLMAIEGEFFGEPFVLTLLLEPKPQSMIRELFDTLRNEVRPILDDDFDIPF